MRDFLAIADEAIDKHEAMQKRTELAAFLALVAARPPRCIYEIGTASGGTLWALTRALSNTMPNLIVSIDLPGGPFSGGAHIDRDGLDALLSDASSGAIFGLHVIRGNSRTVEPPTRPADLLIIDGDHSYAGVKADWERWGPLVAPGGIVAFHDIVQHPESTGVEVAPLWHEICEIHATVEIVDPTDLGAAGNQWGGIGIVFR